MNHERKFAAARFESIRKAIAVPQVALALEPVADADMCAAEGAQAFTDGDRIVYDPKLLVSMPAEERLSMISEEILHVQMLHPWRLRALMDLGVPEACGKQACEHVMAEALVECNVGLFAHPPCPQEFLGLSVEAIAHTLHARMPKDPSGKPSPNGKPGQGQPGAGQPDPNAPPKPGTVVPAPSGTSQQAARVQTALLNAALGKGKIPGSMVRLAKRIRQPSCTDLLAALLAFVEASAKGRKVSDWTRTDRYVSSLTGFYSPHRKRIGLPPIAVGVDSSGSIDERLLGVYIAGLQRVLDDAEPERITGYACDSEIHATHSVEPGDKVPVEWPGGGGTDFRPVFDAVKTLPEQPCCLVYLTDLQGTFPEREPAIPTLWVVQDSRGNRPAPPWGTAIYLD